MLYKDYFSRQRSRIFLPHDRDELIFTDETIYTVVAELWPYRVLGDKIDVLAKALQIFRTSALKSGEGQYLTPLRVVRPAVMAMEITSSDKVIDPACGTGGFLAEALRQVAANEFPNQNESWYLVKWANDNLYGVDGHGSPSQEQRIGQIPYIKVSDLRAGLVNINPTNRVPRSVAELFWRGTTSGLQPFDLICPERTSRNIGDFCVLILARAQSFSINSMRLPKGSVMSPRR